MVDLQETIRNKKLHKYRMPFIERLDIIYFPTNKLAIRRASKSVAI
jgi:hypothetical protein